MKRNRLLVLVVFSIVVLLLLNECNRCKKNKFYCGLSAANGGDHLKILVDNNLVYENKFDEYYRWGVNDMQKLVEDYCPQDSVLKIELKLLNYNRDTLFEVNSNQIKGLYISTAPFYRGGGFYIIYDYVDGGLKDVVWEDSGYPY